MAKKQEVKKQKVKKQKPVEPPDKIKFRCNICGKVNDKKECCGNDFTQMWVQY